MIRRAAPRVQPPQKTSSGEVEEVGNTRLNKRKANTLELIEKVAQLSQGAAQKLQVKSALNPILWLCGITTPLFLVACYCFKQDVFLKEVMAIASLVPMTVACISYGFLVVFKPDKLQSEEYQIRQQSLQIIQEKASKVHIDPVSLNAMSDHVLKQIENTAGKLRD